ncbi:DNA repair protein RecO [Phaeospirillum tilakii]|uniref:DNA repair protein RecO n=1 Tax=Phaeospirillum tilakii TaxID=741673 RepID=A0ABW5C8Z6_9PROT
MEWDDEALLLAVRRHGEHAGIVSCLTQGHGRVVGLVHGIASRERRGVVQVGNRVRLWWRARLPEQMGTLKVELVTAHAAAALGDAGRLAALAAGCALAERTLPERAPQPAAFAALAALLDALPAESWASVYVHFELALLRDLGFGLDLSACAVSGTVEDLAYVSPRTGRAVSRAAGEPWRDRLLPLPPFLTRGGEGSVAEIRDALRLTGYFLDRHAGPLPPARARLVDRF